MLQILLAGPIYDLQKNNKEKSKPVGVHRERPPLEHWRPGL